MKSRAQFASKIILITLEIPTFLQAKIMFLHELGYVRVVPALRSAEWL